MGKNEKKAGILLSYITLSLQFLATFLITPFILEKLGSGEYGLYQLIGSAVSYLSLLGLGFSSAYLRFYSRYKSRKDERGVESLNALFIIVFLVMSAVCVLLGMFLVFNIRNVFGAGIGEDSYHDAKVIMTILVFNMALVFPKNIFVCNVCAHEKFIFQRSLNLFQALLGPLLDIVMIMAGLKAVGLAFAGLIVSIVDITLNIIYNFKKLKIKFYFKSMDFNLFIEIFAFTFFVFMNQIVDMVGGRNVDIFIIGRICGTDEVTKYSIGDKFVNLYYSIAAPIAAVFAPQVNRIVAETDDDTKLTNIFTKVGKMQLIILLLILSSFILFGREFIRFWISTDDDTSYYVAFIIMLGLTVSLSQNVGIEIQRAKNKHQIRSVVYFIMVIGNVILTIPLVKIMGAVGAAVGTFVSLVLGTVLFMNYFYYKFLNIEVKGYWNHLASIALRLVPGFLVVQVIKGCLSLEFGVPLIILALAYALYFIFICWKFVLTDDEKKQIPLINRLNI